MRKRKIFYWGSKPLGLMALRYLVRVRDTYNFEITGICISQEDIDKYGVGGQDIEKIANKNKIKLYKEDDILSVSGDVGIAIGYPHKIPGDYIVRFKNGIVNLHFGPLPYYRGAKTLTHAILNREKRYGVTLHLIDKQLDTGPIISVKWKKLSSQKTCAQITSDFEKLAYSFFKDSFPSIIQGEVKAVAQSVIIENEKITPKYYTSQSIEHLYKIDPSESFDSIFNKTRALQSKYSNKKPYIEEGTRRIYLFIDEN